MEDDMATYSELENGKEIDTVASLFGAAKLWNENPARRVYHLAPTGPVGPDAWQRGDEVAPEELRRALKDCLTYP
jgi:hypothetical protein